MMRPTTPQRAIWNDEHEQLGWRLAGLALLVILSIWLAGLWVHGTDGGVRTGPLVATDLLRPDAQRPTGHRVLRFEPQGQGLTQGPGQNMGFIARDHVTGAAIGDLGFESDGFVVSTVRSLNRARTAAGIDLAQPFRLTRWNNGQVLLEDMATGGQIEMTAFGRTNAKAFVRLFGDTP